MKFYSNLYTTRFYRNKKHRICRKLKSAKGNLALYVIVLSETTDLLEIYHSSILRQSYFKEKELYVIGIAETHPKAVRLSTDIILELYQKTGAFDIKEYTAACFNS